MQISNNNSTSFGSIQVQISKMNINQRCISDRLFNSLKYSEKYSKLTSDIRSGEDLDIYMLPKGKRGIEVRFMDPYSGIFVRDKYINTYRLIKEELYSTLNEQVESAADKIVNIYEKIVNGTIKRPKEDIGRIIKGDTEMCKINPDKAEDFTDLVKSYERMGSSRSQAEEQAFEEYKALYHVKNKDADF